MENTTSPETKPAGDTSTDNVSIPVIDPAPVKDHKVGSTGSVIAILLIVVLLVVGAFYVWGQRLSEQRAVQIEAAE